MLRVPQTVRPCDVESVADFLRYYRNSWVGWSNHPEGAQPVNIQVVGGDSVTIQDLTGRAHLIVWDRAQREFTFGTPDLGMVNAPHTIVYLYRQTPREASKGYRPGSVQSTMFNGWDIRAVIGNLTPSDRSIIQNVFYPEYYTLQEATEQLNSGMRVGCALSSKLGLFTMSTWKHPAIAYRRHMIGYLEDFKTAVIPKMYMDAIPALKRTMGVEVVIR